MHGKPYGRILAMIAAVLAATATLADDAAGVIAKVPRFNESVTLDGRLDEAVWSKAPSFEIGEEVADGKATGKRPGPGHRTFVRLWRDGDALYLGFRCENPDLPMFLNAYPKRRDGPVWDDECVEIFVRSECAPRNRQFTFNPLGSVYDGTWGAAVSAEWNGDWQVATSVVRGAWYAETRIPFSTLGGADAILINCCRLGCDANGQRRPSAWKAPGWFAPLIRIRFEE
jgi:hypothetical protein